MLATSTKLPTPWGWTTVGNLVPGASVFDEVGYPVFVRSVGEVSHEKVYRVGLTNKMVERGAVLMTEGQMLNTWNRYALRSFTSKTGFKSVPLDWAEHDGVVRPLSEVAERVSTVDAGQRRLLHVIPVSFPLVLPHRDVPVPPYIMGMVLQMRDPHTGVMKCKEHTWDWVEARFASAGYPLTRTKARLKRWKPDADVVFSSAELNRALRQDRGYSTTTGISDAYLRGSIQQRMELLSGLLDIPVDGRTHNERGATRAEDTKAQVFCNDPRWRDQVLELVRSLGYAAVPSSNSYGVSFRPLDNPYRYPKMRAQLPDQTLVTRNTFQRFCWRIQSVEIEGEAEVRSFEVTGPSGMVTVSDLFLPVVAT